MSQGDIPEAASHQREHPRDELIEPDAGGVGGHRQQRGLGHARDGVRLQHPQLAAGGIPIINLPGVQVESGEIPMATLCLPDFTPGSFLVLATRSGIIKKTPLEQNEKVRSSGIRALTLRDEDELAGVAVSTGGDDVISATAQG
jgi:DNA gyrase subunit A